MVDLHQVEPGLPDGNPWKTFSRWQMAWHTFLAVALTGMIGIMLFALVTDLSGSRSILATAVPYLFALVIPLICAVLAIVIGPWLRRYYPFSQSLLFGGFAVVAVAAVVTIVSVWEWVSRGPCPPDTLCSEPLDGLFWVMVLYGLPLFLVTSIGFGLAVWSPTRKGIKVFWPLLGAVVVIFVAVLVVKH